MESTKLKVITVTSVLTGLSLGGTMLPSIAYAEKVQNADSIAEAFGEKSFHNLELRLRHEGAKDKTLNTLYANNAQELQSARLTSLRTLLTYGTGAMCDTSAQMTATNVTTFLNTKKHNPLAGGNGIVGERLNYTAINEPRGTALNELFVQNSSIPDTNVRVGNQFFTLDNGRFFGKGDYNQNPQSYRGLTVTNDSLMDTTVTYGYIGNVLTNEATTNDFDRNYNQSTNVLHVNWHGVDWGKISAYDYRIKDKGAVGNVRFQDELYSGNNYGLRFNGDTDIEANGLNVNYELEYAKQHGKYNNPINYHAHYWVAGLGASYNGFSAGLRHEVLSGKDNAVGEQFRFIGGNEHDFLGNAGVFRLSPQAGIKDSMLRFGYKYEQWQFRLDGHVFKPQNGSGVRYGKETDLCVRYNFNEHYNVGVAYAKFKAKEGNLGGYRNVAGNLTSSALGSVAKYWLTLGANF